MMQKINAVSGQSQPHIDPSRVEQGPSFIQRPTGKAYRKIDSRLREASRRLEQLEIATVSITTTVTIPLSRNIPPTPIIQLPLPTTAQ